MGQEGDQRGQTVRRGRGARFLGRQELHLYSERIRHPVGSGLSAHYLQQYDLRHGVPHRHRFAGSADRRYEFRHSEPSGRREQVRDDLRRRAEEHRSCRRDVRHRAGGRAGQGFPSAALDGRLPQSHCQQVDVQYASRVRDLCREGDAQVAQVDRGRTRNPKAQQGESRSALRRNRP